jgi:sialidase-1
MRFLGLFSLISSLILSYSSYLFLSYNKPIIKNFPALAGSIALLLILMLVLSIRELFENQKMGRKNKLLGGFLLLSAVLLVYGFLQSALFDYFQPFSLYDDVIYLTLAAFLLLILRFTTAGVMMIFGKDLNGTSVVVAVVSILFITVFWTWNVVQSDFEYQNISGEPLHIFFGGEEGYDIYRIPSLSVISAGSALADGGRVQSDIVLALAEGRRNGSLDDGDVDLVMKRSLDGGKTWSDLIEVRQWEDGVGKIGNPTPVFDADRGVLYLFHIAGSNRPYTTWVMESFDGGLTFEDPYELGDGIVGPGHGIQLSFGEHAGRLLVPAHLDGSSTSWYSDDHGQTWQLSAPVGEGNESEIAEAGDGSLLMAVRTNHSVAKPHGDLYQLFSRSQDGGESWSPAVENSSVVTPICMVSLVENESMLFFSFPNDFHSRAKMTIAKSDDRGLSFLDQNLIYAGPAGYSDMAVLSNGELLLFFENGAVEYDERLTLVRLLKGD